MKKFLKVLYVAFVVYMAMHMIMFMRNAPYRNRFENEAYRNGEVRVAYYSFM